MQFRVVVLIFFFFRSSFSSGEEAAVMLHLRKAVQPDTLGCNLVQAFPGFVYELVQTGKIKLWDSPKKEIDIKPETLKEIERTSGTSFRVTDHLFVYEKWEISKQSVTPITLGYGFTNKNTKGEEVFYGYADQQDLELFLKLNRAPVNINGNTTATWFHFFQLHQYDFNIVQYGSGKVTGLEESIKIKSELFSERTWNAGIPPPVPQKMVLYSIDRSGGETEKNKLGIAFLDALTRFLDENREVFLNAGGDVITDHIRKKKFTVTKAEVSETWEHKGGVVLYPPNSITIYINGIPLRPVKTGELQSLDLLINFKGVKDFLEEKQFYLSIRKINGWEIDENQSGKYLDALMTYPWHKITEYVKYF